MNNLILSQLKLYDLCRYDDKEDNYKKYNNLMMETISKMPLKSVLFALEDLEGLNKSI